MAPKHVVDDSMIQLLLDALKKHLPGDKDPELICLCMQSQMFDVPKHAGPRGVQGRLHHRRDRGDCE